MRNRTTRLARSCAWMSSRCNWSRKTRPPMAATLARPRRVDYEYERAGTASVFLFSEPLACWRRATARARRTKADWAVEVADLLEGRYADCPKVTLVCDNLNTHTPGAFYEVFEPARARELVRRLEFCYTPKHGSWAEHRRERTEFDDAPMPAWPPHRRPRDAARRSVGVVHRRHCYATRCRLADAGSTMRAVNSSPSIPTF